MSSTAHPDALPDVAGGAPTADEPRPVDVAAVMAEIRAAVEEKRRAGIYPPLAAADVRPVAAQSAGAHLPADRHIQALANIARLDLDGEPIRSHRPVLGAPIKAFKRFTRFWVRRYTDSLFLRQSHFNSETAAATAALHREIAELRREVETLRNQVAEQRK